MRNVLYIFSVLFLGGCTYTDVYVHRETDLIRKNWFSKPDYVHELLADSDLIFFPDFRYFRPGFENQFARLRVISKEPVSIHYISVKIVNLDTNFLYEFMANETEPTREIEGFAGKGFWNYYAGGIMLLGKESYSDFYGASEIEITVSFSTNNDLVDSKTFTMELVSEGHFILSS